MDRLWNLRQPHINIVPTFWCSINFMVVWFIIFVGCGYMFFNSAIQIREMDIRYDDVCEPKRNTGDLCKVRFTPNATITDPVVYYRLDNFYSNYRSFVKSKDIYQLRGKEKTLAQEAKCDGTKSYADLLTDDWFEVN